MKILAVVACLVVGCSSTVTPPPPAECRAAGTYTLTYTPDRDAPGTCSDTSHDPTVVTITTSGDKSNVAFQGSTGSGCAGAFYLGECKDVVKCDGDDGKGSTSTMQMDWTFTSRGFVGTSDFAFRPIGQQPCTSNQNAHGTRK